MGVGWGYSRQRGPRPSSSSCWTCDCLRVSCTCFMPFPNPRPLPHHPPSPSRCPFGGLGAPARCCGGCGRPGCSVLPSGGRARGGVAPLCSLSGGVPLLCQPVASSGCNLVPALAAFGDALAAPRPPRAVGCCGASPSSIICLTVVLCSANPSLRRGPSVSLASAGWGHSPALCAALARRCAFAVRALGGGALHTSRERTGPDEPG